MTFDLSAEFARFAGRAVTVTVKPGATQVRQGVSLTELDSIVIDHKDPVVVELAAAARKAGLYLQLHAVGYQYEKHLRRDLLHAYLEKGSDNQWRLGSRFTFG